MQHQSLECPLRLVTCRFCGDMVPAGRSASDVRDRLRGLSEHESMCGSRTTPCDSCGRSVMLKEMDVHNIAVHPKNWCARSGPYEVDTKWFVSFDTIHAFILLLLSTDATLSFVFLLKVFKPERVANLEVHNLEKNSSRIAYFSNSCFK